MAIRIIATFIILAMGLGQASIMQAQDAEPLQPMQRVLGSLAEGEVQEWRLATGAVESSLYARPLNSTLDPMLSLLDAEGELVTENDDANYDFSTRAQLLAPADGDYRVQLSGKFGEGAYELMVVPGQMTPQWFDDFENRGIDWQNLRGARLQDGQLSLETPLFDLRVFAPLSAPRISDLYLQARYSFADMRDGTQGGFIVRGFQESNGEYTAAHFLWNPLLKEWALETSDITGSVTLVESGTIPEAGDSVTLGLLAQGDELVGLVNGAVVGRMDYAPPSPRHTLWGLEVVNGTALVDDFWFATPIRPEQDYPSSLESFDSLQANQIGAQLIEAELLPETSSLQRVFSESTYTIARAQQRSFMLGQTGESFDMVTLGSTVRMLEGSNVGCGISARYLDEENQLIAFVDTQNGAGLLYWEHGVLALNNYTLLPEEAASSTYELLLILQGQHVSYYVNGQLVAQNLVPRRAGNIGTALINYGDSPSSCTFSNYWVWQ